MANPRSVLLQLLPATSLLSTWAYFLSSSPIAFVPFDIRSLMPPLFVGWKGEENAFELAKAEEEDCRSWRGTFAPTRGAKEKILFQELQKMTSEVVEDEKNDSSASTATSTATTAVFSPLWLIRVQALVAFSANSRGYHLVVNLYKISCVIGILYSSWSAIFVFLSFVFIVPYALFHSLFLVVALGKAMDIRDEDLIDLFWPLNKRRGSTRGSRVAPFISNEDDGEDDSKANTDSLHIPADDFFADVEAEEDDDDASHLPPPLTTWSSSTSLLTEPEQLDHDENASSSSDTSLVSSKEGPNDITADDLDLVSDSDDAYSEDELEQKPPRIRTVK